MMNRTLRCCFGVMLLCGVAMAEEPALKLPALFADHMVLQREMKVPVWGWAAPNEKITVKIAGQKVSVTADAKGKWMIRLKPMKAGGPFTMTVAGKTTVTIKDILIGEVWLCSGQSNMAMAVRNCKNWRVEIRAAKDLPRIRHYRTEGGKSLYPTTRTGGSWQVCNSKTVAGFTATGFFFGRELHKELNVPIGLINSSVGGSSIGEWGNRPELRRGVEDKAPDADPPELVQAVAEHKKAKAERVKACIAAKKANKPAPKHVSPPSVLRQARRRYGNGRLYNGMIHPLIPYGLRGAIWYQGEADAGNGNAYKYRKSLPAMIKGWRAVWGQGDFPFFFVQLPNFGQLAALPGDAKWAVMRESQAKALAVPNTGMAVTIDVGDARSIHPGDKKPVGQRLALCALATVYGKDVVYRGPTHDKVKIDGARVTVRFKHLGGGLVVKGEALKGFAVAGKDEKWAWADASIDGDTVVLTSDMVAKPVAVRYAWGMNPECGLYNKAGLPAPPFRTDDWPVVTQPKPKPEKK